MKKTLYLLAGIAVVMTGCSRQEDIFEDVLDISEVPEVEVNASFSFSTYGLDATFTNTSQGSSSYEWDFGDGFISTEEFPKHTYADNGDYPVKLTVRNSKGTEAYAESIVTIFKDAVTSFDYKQQTYRAGKFGRLVDFNASDSKNLVSIVWDFGDGTVEEKPGTELKVTHEYSEYGTYQVKASGKGIYDDVNILTREVVVEPLTELLYGGGMEAQDAEYWTVKEYWMMAEDWSGPLEGTPQFVHEWGYKGNGPSAMKEGCLRVGGDNQFMQYGCTSTFYQPIEVEEGEILEISADIKWGEKSMDSGVLFLCVSDNPDTFGTDDTAILQMFNYWNAGGTPLPAFDGNLSGIGLPGDSGYNGDGSPTVRYTVPATGTIYFGFELRSVWGECFGPGADFYFDNLSVRVVFE